MAEIRVLTRGPKHHFFGYYGVDAWDPDIQAHLALETGFDDHRPVLRTIALLWGWWIGIRVNLHLTQKRGRLICSRAV
jgi:hypothetical protein